MAMLKTGALLICQASALCMGTNSGSILNRVSLSCPHHPARLEAFFCDGSHEQTIHPQNPDHCLNTCRCTMRQNLLAIRATSLHMLPIPWAKSKPQWAPTLCAASVITAMSNTWPL